MSNQAPMFPTAKPLCEISWIDCDGKPTGDDNPAVGLAITTQVNGEDRAYPICADHLASMGKVHHAVKGGCRHASHHASTWRFVRYAALLLLLSLPVRLGGCARTIVVVQGPLVSCSTSPSACQSD